MPVTITPNMNLTVPVTGSEPGPDWANDLNASLSTIDGHDHSAGYGVQIKPNGLNINSDLTMAGNNLTSVQSVRFSPQAAPLAGGSDLGCLFEVGVDLYYNDGNGNHVRITQSGGVAGSPGSISNLTSPASAAYVAISSTFVWQSAALTPANMDFASAILRNLSASSKGLTLSPPAAMPADYTITLPFLPASTLPLIIDSSGNISASQSTYDRIYTPPTVQVLTSGATYTRPSSPAPLYIKVTVVGAGGGGSGGGQVSGGEGSAGADGTATTFGSSLLTANGGTGAPATSTGGSSPGGTATISAPAYGVAIQGSAGSSGASATTGTSLPPSGNGGASILGGAGTGASPHADFGTTTANAVANTGSGGAGGKSSGAGGQTLVGGNGGGSGGFLEAVIPNPSSSYSYAIGTGGTGGVAGTNGTAGGNGADGIIIVEEFYGA